jgi:membrane protein implicated in regulation of membrane protease activity
MFTNLGAFVLAWYNLPFSLLLAVCALLATLQLIGLGGDESDSDLEGEADLDQDLDTEPDLDSDSAADTDTDAEADSPTPTLSLLAFLGVGKAPLLVVLLILFGTLGILGWSANALVAAIFGNYPAFMLAFTGPLALLVAATFTSRMARWIGKALPPLSTTASLAESLVGRMGTVTSPFVDEKYGLIHLRDSGGTLISVFAISAGGETLKRGESIVLVSYQAARKCYVAMRSKALL